MNRRRAASTVAFLVGVSPTSIACCIRLSSISMFVRTMGSLRCVRLYHFCVPDETIFLKIPAKSLTGKYLTSNSLFVKDLGYFRAKSLSLRDRCQGDLKRQTPRLQNRELHTRRRITTMIPCPA